MKLDKDTAEAILQIANGPTHKAYKQFNEALWDRLDRLHIQIETLDDINEIKLLQGAIAELRTLIDLDQKSLKLIELLRGK